MACLYEMNETGIPFDVYKIRGIVARTVRKPLRLFGFTRSQYVPIFEHFEEHDRAFYTLRVCKGCRGDWIAAQREWWNTKPEVWDE